MDTPEAVVSRSVEDLAPAYFREFGYEGVRIENDGIQTAVVTKHCLVRFYHHRGDLGSDVRPRVGGRYVAQLVDEVPIRFRLWGTRALIRGEVERQMQLAVKKFRPALEGDITDWPTR